MRTKSIISIIVLLIATGGFIQFSQEFHKLNKVEVHSLVPGNFIGRWIYGDGSVWLTNVSEEEITVHVDGLTIVLPAGGEHVLEGVVPGDFINFTVKLPLYMGLPVPCGSVDTGLPKPVKTDNA